MATWPTTRTASDYTTGEGAEAVNFQDFVTRDKCAVQAGWTWYVPEVTSVTSSFVAYSTKDIFLPDSMDLGDTLTLRFRSRVTIGTPTLSAYLYDVDGAVAGTTVNTVLSTSFSYIEVSVAVPILLGREFRQFALYAKHDGTGSDGHFRISTETMFCNARFGLT